MSNLKTNKFQVIPIGAIWVIALLAWPLAVVVGSALGYESGSFISLTSEPLGYNNIGFIAYLWLMLLAFMATIIYIAFNHLKSIWDSSVTKRMLWVIVWFLIATSGALVVYFFSLLFGLFFLFTIFESLGAAIS